MPGYVMTVATVLTCSHGGKVTITPGQGRAQAGGAAIAAAPDGMVVTGCGVSGAAPCTAVTWSGTASRVLVGGRPAMLQALPPAGPVPGAGLCAGPPPTTPLVASTQLRASGT